MRVLFRVDANQQMGTGHLMRCLTLADKLRARNAKCTFICRSIGLRQLASRIEGSGHRLLALPENKHEFSGCGDDEATKHADWLPWSWHTDSSMCLKLLGDEWLSADWLIVDHYALDWRWEIAMSGIANKTMVIDDLKDRRHVCDVILDQNYDENRGNSYFDLVPATCKTLLGTRYALLREEFSNLNQSFYKQKNACSKCKNLLVMFGGADPLNLTQRVVDVLIRLGWDQEVNVVAGPLYQDLGSLANKVAQLPFGRLYAPADNIGQLMSSAEFAIGSPGGSSWERCAASLPCIAVAQAANQERIGVELGRLGAHAYLGRGEMLLDSDLEGAINYWLSNPHGRHAMGVVASKLCDGKGAERVANQLVNDGLNIRLATLEDATELYTIRNHEETRRYFFDSSSIALDKHRGWYRAALSSANIVLLVVESSGGQLLGSVRFDLSGIEATISIYLDPSVVNQGIGRVALERSARFLVDYRPEIKTIRAEVLTENAKSQGAFLAAGFKRISECLSLKIGSVN